MPVPHLASLCLSNAPDVASKTRMASSFAQTLHGALGSALEKWIGPGLGKGLPFLHQCRQRPLLRGVTVDQIERNVARDFTTFERGKVARVGAKECLGVGLRLGERSKML